MYRDNIKQGLNSQFFMAVDNKCAQLYSDTSANEDNSFRNHIR